MLDTVRLWLPNFGIRGLDDEKWEQTSRYGVFRLRTCLIHPDVDHVRVAFNEERSTLNVELSLSRLIHGHNRGSVTPRDLPECIEALDTLLAWGLTDSSLRTLVTLPVPSVATWSLTRVDTFFDFKSVKVPASVVHEALMRLQPSGRLVAYRVNDETAYFRGPSRRKREEIVIYDKGKQSGDLDAAGFARIEVRLRGSAKIKEAFGTKSARLADVVDAVRCRRVLVTALAKLHVRPDESTLITGFDELATRIGAKKAARLWQYVQFRASAPRSTCCTRLGLAAETGRRYERELRRVGLYPAVVKVTGIHEELLAAIDAWCDRQPRDTGELETARTLAAADLRRTA